MADLTSGSTPGFGVYSSKVNDHVPGAHSGARLSGSRVCDVTPEFREVFVLGERPACIAGSAETEFDVSLELASGAVGSVFEVGGGVLVPRGPLPPLVHKIRSGRKLQVLRETALLSQQEVADHLGWSQSKVDNVESATSALRLDDLTRLLDVYEADESTRKECRELAILAKHQLPRRKGLLRNMFEGTMRQVVDMEGSAATVWRHNSMMIPGLLQTEAYMRYIFRAYRPSPTREQIDRWIQNRLARQAVLDTLDQEFWFVIHEAALRSLENIDGDSAVLQEQARHLMEAIDRSNVEVQVAPFRHGYYPGQAETYAIFGFDTEPVVQVTYVEKYDGGDILRDTKNLTRFRTFWDHQRVHALGPEQTRPFLRELSRPL
jgi:transcriptional regulator with XRE-family HTH domain